MPLGFSVDELKQKAGKAKDSTVSTFQSTKDRYKSAPGATVKWGSQERPPPPPVPPSRTSRTSIAASPPPPPSRTLQPSQVQNTAPPPPPAPSRASRFSQGQSAATPPPPPPSRTSRPNLVQNDTAPVPLFRNRSMESPPAVVPRRVGRDNQVIDWTNLSQEDKEVFFSWLDEFFSRFLNVPIHSRGTIPPINRGAKPNPSEPTTSPPVSNHGPPPKIQKRSKPQLSSALASVAMPVHTTAHQMTSDSSDFVTSHPPATTYGSAAEDLAQYFRPSTYWETPWYSSGNRIPLSLQGNTHITYFTSYQFVGPKTSVYVGVAFSDLSICWFTVDFSTAPVADPNNTSLVKRSAKYLGRPQPMDQAALLEAHETYGTTIAAFAESFLGTGEYCARGECWDLANEALKYFNDFDYVPKPIPSLSRTHGHLIFEGKASGKGNLVGRWRGGDDRVRRGDIVEWRKVKINFVGAPPNSWAILGDPDHTAIIVRDSQPRRAPVDGQSLSPADLGSLEVVEQSVGSPPDRKVYDLTAFEQGEMWIYRPISMQVYLGTSFVARCPAGVRAMEI